MYDGDGFDILTISRDEHALKEWQKYFNEHEDEWDDWDSSPNDYDISNKEDRDEFCRVVERSIFETAEDIATKYDYLFGESRYLYTVEIPEDNGSNYIDFDSPLTDEQAWMVGEALARHPKEASEIIRDNSDLFSFSDKDMLTLYDHPEKMDLAEMIAKIFKGKLSGNYVYEELKNIFGSDKSASLALNEGGFTGIKYPADYRRGGRADGAKNYVIFNEKDLQITNHLRFFRGKEGEAYGFTVDGKIYIDPKHVNAETPIHEYAHLWATALQQKNAKEWQNVVGLMKGTDIWEEVKRKYPELKTDEELADEVLATYSGQRGAERLREEMRRINESNGDVFTKAEAIHTLERVKQAIKRFWRAVADFLHIRYTSAEQVADQVLGDLLSGVNPNVGVAAEGKAREQFIGENGAAAIDHAEDVSTRMDNLAVAREMEEAKKDAKAIKIATGWERGADGKWRYEVPDIRLKPVDEWLNKRKKFTLADIIEANDPIFKMYPKLKGITINKNYSKSDAGGYYDKEANEIKLPFGFLKNNLGSEVSMRLALNEFKHTLGHEIQHVIQHEEGFANGGSPETFSPDMPEDARREYESELNEYERLANEYNSLSKFERLEDRNRRLREEAVSHRDRVKAIAKRYRLGMKGYRRISGEVEARNVEKRMNMTPIERMTTLASETEDVAREDQIFLGVRESKRTSEEEARRINGQNGERASLRGGTFIRSGSYFSGGGLLEEGLKEYLDPKVAVEFSEKISGVYSDNFGHHIVTADVRNVDPRELTRHIDGPVEYFHASPVCKNFSKAKRDAGEVELDKETAQSTADFIRENHPKVVTIENVKGYRNSEALKIITDQLTRMGYDWDAHVYNAADYGGYTKRERLIVRAVRDGVLPPLPQKLSESERPKGWMDAVEDLISTLPEKKSGVPKWMDERLKAEGIDWRHIDKPLYVFGQGNSATSVPHAFADELLPTLRTKGGDVIIMPDGRVLRATPRVLARVTGLADDYKMPITDDMAHTIIGNGIPTQMSEHVIGPLLEDVFNGGEKATDESLITQRRRENVFASGEEREGQRDSKRGTPNLNLDVLNGAQQIYEESLKGYRSEWDEAWHDSLVSVKRLQEALSQVRGTDLKDFENVYWHAVTLSSVTAAEQSELLNKYIQPLMDTVKDLCKKHGMTQDDLEVYLNCKHGLERNQLMAEREAEQAAERNKEKNAKAAKLFADGKMKEDAYNDYVAKHPEDSAVILEKLRKKRDYSGLTDIFNPKNQDGMRDPNLTNEDYEREAAKLVADVEQKLGKEDTAVLWYDVHQMNEYALRKSYLSGLISKEQYEEIKNMYQYYVPLRGFSETTAGDVYEYVTRGEQRNQQVVKKAKGRTSRAADIFATMMNMANSSISMGNRNKMKQKLLNLALRSSNPLLTVSSAWYETDANGYDVMVMPPIDDSMDADTQRETIEQWEENMKMEESLGNVKQMKDGVRIKMRMQAWQKNEHCVPVRRGGKEYLVWVNGNPRAAQALNGELEKNRINTSQNWFWKRYDKVLRYMSSSVTSLNPEFLISNFMRDFGSARLIGFSKYGVGYMAKFDMNVKRLFPGFSLATRNADYRSLKGIYELYHDYKNGLLDENNEMHRLFKEFIQNGGETGYTTSLSVNDYQSKMESLLNDGVIRRGTKKVWHSVFDYIEGANRGIENTCRFAAYMTSRQNGRSVLQSVADAKEASTNFNLHGSGALFNTFARRAYTFTNPAIQSLVQYCQMTTGAYGKQAAVRMGIALGGTVMAGVAFTVLAAMTAALSGGDGDPDGDYWNLNPYTRRNYIVLRSPLEGKWIKIALAPEIRAIYGCGVIAVEAMMGHMENESIPAALSDQLLQLSHWAFMDPVKFFDKNETESTLEQTASAFIPSVLKPIFDAYIYGRDFMGRPISGANDYNKNLPEFKRASYDTSKILIEASRFLNNISGGNDYKKGLININPSNFGYTVSQYAGGWFQFLSKCSKIFAAITDEDMRDTRNIPFGSRFLVSTDSDYSRYLSSSTAYKWYNAEAEAVKTQVMGFESELEAGDTKNKASYEALVTDPSYERYMMFDYAGWWNDIKDLRKERKEQTDDKKQKEVTKQIYEVQKKAQAAISKADDEHMFDAILPLNLQLARETDAEKRKALQKQINELRIANLVKLGVIQPKPQNNNE